MEVTEGRVSEPEPRSIETIQFEQQRKNIEKKKKEQLLSSQNCMKCQKF